MKRLLTILLVLLHASAFSQSFWSKVVDDKNLNKSSFTANSLFWDTMILVGGYVGTASCSGSELFAYDLQGKRIWEKPGYFDLIHTDLNSFYIYTAGYDIGADDVLGDEQVIISKYDINGKEIFQNSYPQIPYHKRLEFVPNCMDINEYGSIIISSKNSIIKADPLGKVISETPMKFQHDISSIQFIGANLFLINIKSTLYRSDSSFNHLDSISFSENNVSALIQNDTIYCLFPDKLVILDTNLKILDTVITNNDIEFKRIKPFGGDLWIQGVQGNLAKFLQLHNLLVSNTFTFNSLIQSPDFLVFPDNIIFTGNSASGQIAVYSYNKKAESDPVSLPDIEIVDFEIDSITIDYINWPPGTGEKFARGFNFETEMVLKNNGKDTITSFAIYSYLDGGMNCAHNYFYYKFTNQLLLPNQKLKINLNRIYQDGIYSNTLCFECLAPNSMIETNLDKNKLCKTFDLTGLEDLANSRQYHIYPNPVKDFIKLELEDNGTKEIMLTNLNGSLLFETNINSCETTIDFSGLVPGIYLLSITSESGRFVQKIVKE